MATKNIEIQDSTGNIYYPHTDSNVVKHGSSTVFDALNNLSNPNLLINGDFQVWQRGTSFNNTTLAPYTVDRWRVGTNYSDIVRKGSEGMEFTTTAGERWWLIQPLELNPILASQLSGKSITLSFYIKADIAFTAKATFNINASAPGDSYYSPTYNVTTSYVKQVVTFQLPTLTSSDTILSIAPFRIPSDLQASLPSTTVYIKNVKLELGSVATPFVPKPYVEELAMCQRYYEVCKVSTTCLISVPYFMDSGSVVFRVPKRVAPTVTIYDYNGVSGCYWIAAQGSYAVGDIRSRTDGFTVVLPTSGTNIVNNKIFNYSADAEI